MQRLLTMRRLSILFLSLFAVLTAGTLVFQHFWLDPGERCEKRGQWYDVNTRICAQPIYIPDITGRAAGVSRAEASDAKNRELVELEAEVRRQKAKLAADAAAQRQAVEAATPK